MTDVPRQAAGQIAGLLGGLIASAIFRQTWRIAAGEDDAPSATDPRRSWREVLVAAAVQGAIFGVVKAAIDRWATAAPPPHNGKLSRGR